MERSSYARICSVDAVTSRLRSHTELSESLTMAQCLYRALNVVCLETLTSLDVTARREVKQYGFNSGGESRDTNCKMLNCANKSKHICTFVKNCNMFWWCCGYCILVKKLTEEKRIFVNIWSKE